MDAIVDRIRDGDRSSLARAMSLVDGPGDEAQELADRLRRSTGNVPWWGFTGPPGVGKSTMIDTLLTMLRGRGRRIGVVAVDPTSPTSGGALLGDRVRMMRHAVDHDVFIRSLATHNREGGLSEATLHCARLLELGGYDPVLIETVGVGQNEVDVASVADICVVVLGPGFGDDIQLIKAGLLEVADIVVVNKCDLPGADRLLEEVRTELGQSSSVGKGRSGRLIADKPGGPPAADNASIDVFGIEAKSGAGVECLLARLLELDDAARGQEQREKQRKRRLLGELRHGAIVMFQQALDRVLGASVANELLARFSRDNLSFESIVARLADEALAGSKRRSVKTPEHRDIKKTKRS